MLVRNTIGCPSTNLGLLIAKALTGGRQGTMSDGHVATFAFDIPENSNPTANFGLLIDKAEPFWNIYSRNSPGYWWLDSTRLRFRLNGYKDDPKLYRYALGDFRSYNHQAVRLGAVINIGDEGAIYVYPNVDRVLRVEINLGEIDWKTITGAAKIGVILSRANGVDFYSNIVDYSAVQSSNWFYVTLYGNQTEVIGASLSIRGAFYLSNNQKICDFPEGTISYKVVLQQVKPIMGTVKIYRSNGTQFTNFTTEAGQIVGQQFTFGITLNSIVDPSNPDKPFKLSVGKNGAPDVELSQEYRLPNVGMTGGISGKLPYTDLKDGDVINFELKQKN